ncbi:bifunctional adenosylcobinamide kinase/adenosylcobinamide-phosphate guanylyltransferase [Neobacillus pocheonensis]|uniref:Bifunctional adenosylcobinamide kinase/adenosylcobinamide-phosphate guanylyltransferase n=1 Tax=Neobacillus pocheonensis TaxID=363869 RepID=A0ABT0W942_9BACI|nr:bifunctional adenosylcobinamide kinase/adenosylcobinamide-phosphate guanylyltransferase [Neobacillus pocheonensis]
MHFITGGAFNGKRVWVKNRYMVTKGDRWLSAYDHAPLPTDLTAMEEDLIILEGIEIWLKKLTREFNANKCRKIWNSCLGNWLMWERAKVNRKLVVIGTDITKGIVPMEKENRLWRDVTGWAYQDCAKVAEKMEIIWYGINQTIK